MDGPELYVDLLVKNRTPYVTTQVSAHSAKRKIAEFSQTPVDFLQKYDELKSKKWVTEMCEISSVQFCLEDKHLFIVGKVG